MTVSGAAPAVRMIVMLTRAAVAGDLPPKPIIRLFPMINNT
ncbi:MAG: hypothetical protein O0V67_06340 [Methanocorpusculum sp.]|nr:hypothetical protein [Methanocorpusculum sp.]